MRKALVEHVKGVHEGIKNASCHLCDKKYISKGSLSDHIKDAHFKSKISCELCDAKLARVVNYRMHVKKVHKDLSEEKMTALLQRINTIRADFDKMEHYYS